MNSRLLRHSVREFKSKIHSTIGTFCIISLAYFLIMSIAMPLNKMVAFYSLVFHEGYLQLFTSLTSNILTLHDMMLFPPLLAISLFFITYGIRNNYATYLPFSSTRNSYMLSDIATGVVYSALFALVSFACDCLIRIIIGNNSGSFTFLIDAPYAVGIAAGNMIAILGISIALFATIMAIINSISRKKYYHVIIYPAIAFLYAIMIYMPSIVTQIMTPKLSAYLLLCKSPVGMLTISIVFTAIVWLTNYLLLRKEGGFRR